jgi:hypothetical protein
LRADAEAPTLTEPIRIRGGNELLVTWDHIPGRTSLEALASQVRQVFVKKKIRTNMRTYPNSAQEREGKLVIIKIQIMDPGEVKKRRHHRRKVRAAREEINLLLTKATLAKNTMAQPIAERRQATVRMHHSFKPAAANAGLRV